MKKFFIAGVMLTIFSGNVMACWTAAEWNQCIGQNTPAFCAEMEDKDPGAELTATPTNPTTNPVKGIRGQKNVVAARTAVAAKHVHGANCLGKAARLELGRSN